MVDFQKHPLGASFGDAYDVNRVELEAVIELISPYEAFDIIFHNEEVDVYRVFTQTDRGTIKSFNLTFIAERIGYDEFLVTSGTIRTTEYVKEQEYEKVGKRILYKATKQRWNTIY